MWPVDGTWKGRWRQWQFKGSRKLYLQELDVEHVLEDSSGFPCIVPMQSMKGRMFKFDQLTYDSVVREMVTGCVEQAHEWE